MSQIAEAQLTFLENYPMMVNPYFRMVNNRKEEDNVIEDFFNKKKNNAFQISLLDKQRK